MELSNEFEVSVPLEQAWGVLTDLERIAPCLPGAQLQEVEGEEFRGTVKVKVGPITAQYKGKAHFVELDADGRRAVLSASGRDTKGQGNASATITAQLADHAGKTHVSLVTDLTLTGKVAQFGRGVLADVSAKLMNQFVDNLETTVLAGNGNGNGNGTLATAGGGNGDAPPEPAATAEPEGPAAASASPAAAPSTTRVIDSPEAEPVDLLDAAGGSVLKRLLPLVVGVVIVALLVRRARRRR